MNFTDLTDEELAAQKPTMEQILAMTTEVTDPNTHQVVLVPDLIAQHEALLQIEAINLEQNQRAIAKQNEEAARTKVCYARPVAGVEGNEYDAFMHLNCGSPEDWPKLLINDTIRNQKCIGCGFPLSQVESSGN